MLSAILITKNEENNIRRCLESIKFVDEIIVFDSGSDDGTTQICREYTNNVFVTDWPGFGIQKQRALDAANGTWILSIDADEVVDAKLKHEILSVISSDKIAGYFLPRLSYLCGKPIRHCGWYPDYIMRLFQKKNGRFTEELVHEEVLVSGETKKMNNHLLHYSYENLDQLIQKYNNYTTLGAQKLFERGKKSSLFKAIIRSAFAFFKLFILKKGFLDGKMGFIIAVSSAETAYYKYLKLSLLSKKI